MINNTYNIIGVMSGTSLDGIDLAYITFTRDTDWKFEMHCAETIPYDRHWIQKLKQLTMMTMNDLEILDEDYTVYLGSVINEFIQRNQLYSIDAVCSHGHTALHQPQNGLTYQIGNLPKLAVLIQQKVVCDFRVQDVALGGQGAPLVPIGDKMLFSEYDYCLNLGGFANISTEMNGNRIAYDICPVNIVLNHYISPLGLNYDDRGIMASKGEIHHHLLDRLNDLPFYGEGFPKSLGLEWVNKNIFPLIDSFRLGIEDILRTFVEHIAIQIANAVNKNEESSMLVTGGGVYNDFLMEQLKKHTQTSIEIPDGKTIEFKEALVFGFLGVLKMRDEINCLRTVTGASKNHSSGRIYCP